MKPTLTPAQIRYVRKAALVRERLSTRALAEKFGKAPKTIAAYVRGAQKGLQP